MIRNAESDIHYEPSTLRSTRDKTKSPTGCIHYSNGCPRWAGMAGTQSPHFARSTGAICTSPLKSRTPKADSVKLSACATSLSGYCLKLRLPITSTGVVWTGLNNSHMMLDSHQKMVRPVWG